MTSPRTPSAILAPIPIPPLSPSSLHQGNDGPPQTPTKSGRLRSDTVLTTSSSSSSDPHLQTPQTPSIIGMLNSEHQSHKMTVASPDQIIWTNRSRKDSYGFGSFGDTSGLSPSHRDSRAFRSNSEVSNMSTESPQRLIVDTAQERAGTPVPCASNDLSIPASSTPCETEVDTSRSISLPPVSRNESDALLPTISQSNMTDVIPSEQVQRLRRPEPKRSKSSSFKAVVRRKLERSKSSFRALESSSDEGHDNVRHESTQLSASMMNATSDTERGEPSSSTTNSSHSVVRPRRSRLKSLLSLPSKRTPSSASIHSLLSTSSNATSHSGYQNGSAIALVPSPSVLAQPIGTPVPASDAVIVRDFAHIVTGNGVVESQQAALSTPPILGPPISSDNSTLSQQVSKEKGRARGNSFAKLKSRARKSSSSGLTLSRPGSPLYQRNQDAHDIPRIVSLPLLSDESAVAERSTYSTHGKEAKKINFFDTVLPKELKVMIMQTLLQSYAGRNVNGRMEGLDVGRRELVKLSRVSTSWQHLCFDGQLWPLSDLMPFAHCLHPGTLLRMFNNSQKCITTLSLRGMDALDSFGLLLSFGFIAAELPGTTFVVPKELLLPRLDSLLTLDLRGCKGLLSVDICTLVAAAPNLKNVNFKGVQAVSSHVIRELSRSKHLEVMNVSRCWDITLGDITVFLERLDDEQAARLQSLHIAGIRSFGRAASSFLPLVAERLVNLAVLDLQGCTYVYDENFAAFASTLDDLDRVSKLQHLNISNCTRLTCKTFGHLARHMPSLTKLEAAGLPDAFREREDDGLYVVRLLKSTPKLQRLDLDGTGANGGLTDRVLDTLACGRDEEGESLGKDLVELRMGFAKNITPDAVVRLIRSCPKLTLLDVDNTAANNAVMREFVRRRSDPNSLLSLIDCRAITQSAYDALVPSTRARRGWTGWPAVPFGYDHESELAPKPVLKTFYSWRRVGIPGGWREVRTEAERLRVEQAADAADGSGSGSGKRKSNVERPNNQRRSSWWRADDYDDDNMRGGCVIM